MSTAIDIPGQTRLQSAELLRVVLGKMGAHADGYEPISYALWYEYARGGLPSLREEVDLLVAAHQRMTAAQTRALYEKHVRTQPEAAFAAARVGLLAVLTQMQMTIGQAAASSDAYGQTLQSFEGSLTRSDPLDGMREQLASVVAHTSEIRGSIGSLSDELLSNKAQVGRLTEELERLREDVLTDPLTGLRNRRGFDIVIASLKTVAEASGEPFSIVMIDIDHFKRVNDTHGHLFGDRVIQQVGDTMRSCIRGGDTAARYGGEEFALLLPSTGARGAQTVAEYIRNSLQRAPIAASKKGAQQEAVTISAGVAVFRLGEDVEDCIRRADRALYTAKNGGRNRVVVAA